MRARMNAAVQLKKGEFVKNIKRLIIFMRPYYLPIVISLVFTAASAVISIFAPQVLSDLVNVITASFGGSPIDMGELGRFAVILIDFYVCNALCTYVSGFIMTTGSQKVSKSLRTLRDCRPEDPEVKDLADKLLKTEQANIEEMKTFL